MFDVLCLYCVALWPTANLQHATDGTDHALQYSNSLAQYTYGPHCNNVDVYVSSLTARYANA